ncbi:threonine-phosphate decarboxylase CobD [Pseudogulbenkiania subflava]|uniref:Putative 8-amino-7-oxononanoate synthase n=1 Tax=Pseudogulbenkiania subflava DSM 22618 TaxID=1123014 RepID=A0A1Y6C5J8_9NEIS|nr:threonine-phosphate decarboxylase CobD [Pseudogulbenkiania subflava]SMF43199.1 L-threonine O-3-phosphate decarboxylase [Pseudogulbenkiania subflava DSM 22618]
MLDHGGGILAAARRYGIPAQDWLDLSTGLNPHGWPVPEIPARAWQRLPETADGLEAAAAEYYGCEALLPVAGSQPAIQALPRLRPACRVGMLAATYAEHPHAWARNGHEVVRLAQERIDEALDTLDVLLVCNPNNPTGWQASPTQLDAWRARLATRGGWLVVDEAFMDCTPEQSMLPRIGTPGLVVLRSIGKFFGLAGARAGFVFAWPELLARLREELGPWTLSGPARVAVRLALQDREWQAHMRERLETDSARLAGLLAVNGLTPNGGSALFQWLAHPAATALHDFLARHGILIRHFPENGSVRFGLPAGEADWQRLEAALSAWCIPR